MKQKSFFANSSDTLEISDITFRGTSIMADKPHPDRSDKYKFLESRQVLGFFKEEGYRVSSIQLGSRGGSRDYGRHTVRLRAPFDNRMPGDLYPEIVFTNSHDGTCSGRLDLGLYRTVCANGLVVAESAGLQFKIPHRGSIREDIIGASASALEFVPRLEGIVTSWTERKLSNAEVSEFGKRALMLRGHFPTPPVSAGSVTAARREADADQNLWNVFNRTQEGLIRGGVKYQGPDGSLRRLRALSSVKQTLDVNQKLWELAEEFLPA